MIVPLAHASQREDSQTNQSEFLQSLLYKTWVPGVDCQPHVACAWEHCFPGKGNYEQVESRPLTIRALPGFSMEPPFLALKQGVDRQVYVILGTHSHRTATKKHTTEQETDC